MRRCTGPSGPAGTASSGPRRCPRPAERSGGRGLDVLRASVGFRPMGVLDDAIREHLHLKRRHGAGEEEALGPARREVAPADSEDGDQAQTEAGAAQPELSEAIPDEAVRSDLHEEEDVELHVHDAEPEAFEEAEAPAEAVAPAEPVHEELEDDHAALGDTPQAGFARVEED